MAKLVECVPNFSEGRNKEVSVCVMDSWLEPDTDNGVKNSDEESNESVLCFHLSNTNLFI